MLRRAADGRLEWRAPLRPPDAPVGPGVHALPLDRGVEALLAVPPGDAGPRPLLVFFHGAGATAAQSITAVGDVARQRGILLLAPTSVATTWDLLAGGWGRDVAVLDAALDQVAQHRAVSRTAFGGFSDGASYALSIGLGNGDVAETVLAFSPGFAAPAAVVGRPRIWITHGRADRVLPVASCGRRVARALADEGYAVTYEEVDGGHVVPADLVERAVDWWLGG